jgi:hypothetical protein
MVFVVIVINIITIIIAAEAKHFFLLWTFKPALSGAHPASYAMKIVLYPGVKQPGRDVDHSPPSSEKVKEEGIYRLTLLPL